MRKVEFPERFEDVIDILEEYFDLVRWQVANYGVDLYITIENVDWEGHFYVYHCSIDEFDPINAWGTAYCSLKTI